MVESYQHKNYADFISICWNERGAAPYMLQEKYMQIISPAGLS